MFSVQCDATGGEVIIGMESVVGMRNVDDGILMAYRCWCGADGVLLTGAASGGDRSGHVEVRQTA